MPNKHSEQLQSGDCSIPEAVQSPQAAQQSLEEAHELRDDQLQSIVGGLRRLQVIRVIGFEN
jgi:hypothetical protein